ncbi:MAG: SUMF1/EgtB/PvdO family nonheme iron enzyme [Kiritimatiellia bacterium]|nr:SUMF1/EgtB/PvdO family nonheme iron enzyme [Kiritimatiellia bacterium]
MNPILLLSSALYLAVRIGGGPAEVETYPSREAIPGGEASPRWRDEWVLMRRVDPTPEPIRLGNPAAPRGANDEARKVRITRPYFIAIFETTRSQLNHLGGTQDTGPLPALNLSYNDLRGSLREGIDWPKSGPAVATNSILGRLRARTGLPFDLPTEAQWEVACRAGTDTCWNDGSDAQPYDRPSPDGKPIPYWSDHALDRLGRYFANGGCTNGPAPVGSYRPNAWGLYDMHGNAYEFCRDWFAPAGHPAYAGDNPKGPASSKSKTRVLRSGSYWNYLFGSNSACTSYARWLGDMCNPSTRHAAVGFRLVLEPSNEKP